MSQCSSFCVMLWWSRWRRRYWVGRSIKNMRVSKFEDCILVGSIEGRSQHEIENRAWYRLADYLFTFTICAQLHYRHGSRVCGGIKLHKCGEDSSTGYRVQHPLTIVQSPARSKRGRPSMAIQEWCGFEAFHLGWTWKP